MTELATFTILGVTVTRYALYALLGFLAPAALGAALAKRYGVRARAAVGFAVLAGVLGLLAGRAVYCLVRRDSLFFSDMGEFLGLAPLFDFTVGRRPAPCEDVALTGNRGIGILFSDDFHKKTSC